MSDRFFRRVQFVDRFLHVFLFIRAEYRLSTISASVLAIRKCVCWILQNHGVLKNVLNNVNPTEPTCT